MRLSTVRSSDYEPLARLAHPDRLGYRWRPDVLSHQPYSGFPEFLWEDVVIQHTVRGTPDEAPLGLVQCYGYDAIARQGTFAMLWGGPAEDEEAGLALGVERVFATLPCRLLYLTEPAAAHAWSAGFESRAPVCARLEDHDRYRGALAPYVTRRFARADWLRRDGA